MSISLINNQIHFTCDRCGNSGSFIQGMDVWKLNFANGEKDDRSFCSQICVNEIFKAEKTNNIWWATKVGA